jgi:hypothetical protein
MLCAACVSFAVEQLMTLVSLHVVTYTLLCFLLPLLYIYPDADIFPPCLYKNVLSGQNHTSLIRIVSLVSVAFQVPMLWLLMFWHVVLALSLYRALVRKVSKPSYPLC